MKNKIQNVFQLSDKNIIKIMEWDISGNQEEVGIIYIREKDISFISVVAYHPEFVLFQLHWETYYVKKEDFENLDLGWNSFA